VDALYTPEIPLWAIIIRFLKLLIVGILPGVCYVEVEVVMRCNDCFSAGRGR
jgi:hypothetical protein